MDLVHGSGGLEVAIKLSLPWPKAVISAKLGAKRKSNYLEIPSLTKQNYSSGQQLKTEGSCGLSIYEEALESASPLPCEIMEAWPPTNNSSMGTQASICKKLVPEL